MKIKMFYAFVNFLKTLIWLCLFIKMKFSIYEKVLFYMKYYFTREVMFLKCDNNFFSLIPKGSKSSKSCRLINILQINYATYALIGLDRTKLLVTTHNYYPLITKVLDHPVIFWIT